MRGMNMKLQAFALASITVLATGAVASATPTGNIGYTFTNGASSSSGYGSGSVGLLTNPLTVGNFNVLALEATTSTPDATSAISGISLEVTNTSTTSTETLNLNVSAINFSSPSLANPVIITGTDSFSAAQASTTDSVSFTEYADTNNAFFGTAVSSPTDTTTFTNGTPVSTYPSGVTLTLAPVSAGTQYSVTDEFQITLAAGASTTFSFLNTAAPTPEPASLGLMGLAGVGALLVGRRRKA